MAVVKNLMIRIGADYSGARKGMQGATQELTKFKRDATRTTSAISGRNGLGGIGAEFRNMRNTVVSSFSQIRGSKGIGGVSAGLGGLRSLLGSASTGLDGLGASATGAGGALGSAGLAAGAFVAVLAIATVGVYKASQAAVQYESDLGRLNMQLKGGSRDFVQWARAQGLAKSSSVEMGATFSVLLSSFGYGNKQLSDQTKQLVHTTRVVASATGRTIEDTTERIRSGLLGNTESIEDLGIFVNISMIESTNAFKKFANGKHWDQLDFRVQQQIRLAAILEQAYARYGDKLQNNVMTKQTLLMEQLKDVKLNLSQAFLPIWDAVLPALTSLAENVAYVTEQIARFTYWLRGWNYDEQTQGTNKQTDAVTNQGDAYNNLGKQAKSARKEIAAFDQLNLLGDPNGSGTGGGGGGATGGIGGGGLNNGGGSGIPPYPPFLNKKYRIEFDTPKPPDAGIGAVATAVTKTVNQMIAETKQKLAQMWPDLQGQTQVGVAGQLLAWSGLNVGVAGGIVPALTRSVVQQWAQMWRDLQAQTGISVPALQTQMSTSFGTIGQNIGTVTQQARLDWKTMLSDMLADIVTYQPGISLDWSKIVDSVASIKSPLVLVQEEWHGALDFMQSQILAYRPNLEMGWGLIATAIRNVKSPLAELKTAWSTTLADLQTKAAEKFGSIVDKINSVITAWSRLKTALTGSPASFQSGALTGVKLGASTGVTSGAGNPAQSDTGRAPWVDNTPVLGDILKGLDWLKDKTSWTAALAPYAAPGPAGMGAIGGMADNAAGAAARVLSNASKALSDLFKGLGIAVPQFATGALVYGPTMAMVGDNRGASTDPEVIAPLSKLEDYIGGGGDNGEVVTVLRAVLQAIKENRTVQAVIARDAVGQAAVGFINEEYRRGNNPLFEL